MCCYLKIINFGQVEVHLLNLVDYFPAPQSVVFIAKVCIYLTAKLPLTHSNGHAKFF